jgi:6-phosphogluconolactonase (cycloisomerase 2 family)
MKNRIITFIIDHIGGKAAAISLIFFSKKYFVVTDRDDNHLYAVNYNITINEARKIAEHMNNKATQTEVRIEQDRTLGEANRILNTGLPG